MAENNQIQSKSVLLDHKMIVEGKTWHEKKELVTTIREEDGREITTFSHLRTIGDRTYQVHQEIVCGKEFPLGKDYYIVGRNTQFCQCQQGEDFKL